MSIFLGEVTNILAELHEVLTSAHLSLLMLTWSVLGYSGFVFCCVNIWRGLDTHTVTLFSKLNKMFLGSVYPLNYVFLEWQRSTFRVTLPIHLQKDNTAHTVLEGMFIFFTRHCIHAYFSHNKTMKLPDEKSSTQIGKRQIDNVIVRSAFYVQHLHDCPAAWIISGFRIKLKISKVE